MSLKTIIYPVKDLEQAKTLYTALLGVAPQMDRPYFVLYHVDDQDIGLDPHGHGGAGPSPTGTSTTSGRTWRCSSTWAPRRARRCTTSAAAS